MFFFAFLAKIKIKNFGCSLARTWKMKTKLENKNNVNTTQERILVLCMYSNKTSKRSMCLYVGLCQKRSKKQFTFKHKIAERRS